MPEPDDYSQLGHMKARKVIFVVVCKDGDPHMAISPRLDYTDAKKVSDWLDGPDHEAVSCGPHRTIGYGALV